MDLFHRVDERKLSMALFRRVSNAAELRRHILASSSGSLLGHDKADVAFVKAALVAHHLQVIVAARTAMRAAKDKQLTTRSWATEVLFNLSGSKNITDSLQKFGIGDDDTDLIVIMHNSSENDEKTLSDKIRGDLVNLSELENVSNFEEICKLHKLKGMPDLMSDIAMLQSFLISRAATKCISL